jgi:RNA polymerase sigma-70 factor (ECF subfamily)
MSRKVTAHQYSSLNGVVEAPNLFQFDSFGPDEDEAISASVAGVTDVVIGANLWREWSVFWPESDIEPFASFINSVPKHVICSAPAGELPWNSTVITGDPVEYVKALREGGSDGTISVAGGIATIRSLFLAGVIDELTVTVFPVITPDGARLFDDTAPLTRLRLVDSRFTSVGNAMLTYALHD